MENLKKEVTQLLEKAGFGPPKNEGQEFTLTPLHGDASNRIYYRIHLPKKSLILMERPRHSAESPSEEITKEPKGFSDYSFINIQCYLEQSSIPVPKIFAYSSDQRLILLEDVGDTTLEKKIQKDPKNLRKYYEKSIELITQLQKLKKNNKCIAWKRKFDQDLLQWEFDHFLEWGLEKGMSISLPQKERKELQGIFKDIVTEIFQMKTCFCHRDFQSRNLMVSNNHFILLDFQDSLQGPIPYDLVALLRDSYIELSENNLFEFLNFFMDKSNIEERQKFIREFDLQTIQRKLKDGGRFHYIHLFKKNPHFLPHVPSSYRYVAQALRRQPEGKHVLPILKKYIQEFSS